MGSIGNGGGGGGGFGCTEATSVANKLPVMPTLFKATPALLKATAGGSGAEIDWITGSSSSSSSGVNGDWSPTSSLKSSIIDVSPRSRSRSSNIDGSISSSSIEPAPGSS